MTAGNRPSGDNGGLSPFRVLGIALVVDQLGKEARMAFRYPTSLASGTSPGEENAGRKSEELFFTLSSRQMAKLFRPKHSLCGQPMTLSVGGTVFCFRAVLMGDPEQEQPPTSPSATTPSNANNNNNSANASVSSQATSTQNTAGNSNSNSDHLVLFSVIVALAPQVDVLSIPISGWFEGGGEDQSAMNQSLHQLHSSASLSSTDGLGSHGSHMVEDNSRVSASFLAIRRIQVSLARLCRVLEREEKRCRYISVQSNHFIRIRADLQKKWEEKAAAAGPSSSTSSKPPTSGNSPKSDFSGKNQATADRKKNHRRGSSYSQGLLAGSASLTGSNKDSSKERLNPLSKKDSNGQSAEQQQDQEQEILEHILAIQNEDGNSSPFGDRKHYGNLGRELVQVFHALSRNDHNFPPSPTILSGREGVVYVNRHIAVAMEAVSLPKSLSPNKLGTAIVRPYHTLLFPNASPSQLLQALQSSGFTAPLQQLLLMVRPSKPLTDIAVDANLPLATVMELALYLVSHGACVASPVLTRASRLACKRVDKIQELALDFSQTFDDWSVSLFLIVSFLTADGITLGESMTALTTGEDPVGSSLRAGILSSIFNEEDLEDFVFVDRNDTGDGSKGLGYDHSERADRVEHQFLPHRRAEELEEVLYCMAIWLLSHQVLGHIQDYLVVTCKGTAGAVANSQNTNPTDTEKVEGNEKATNKEIPAIEVSTFDDGLLKELHDSDCLNGDVSIVAMSWRLGLDAAKLRSWALRHDKLRVVSRVARAGDDWGAV